MIAVTLSPSLVDAIGLAVERSGGDATDSADLAAVWERVVADTVRRADAIRGAVARARCRCANGGDSNDGGRCGRCFGRLAREAS